MSDFYSQYKKLFMDQNESNRYQYDPSKLNFSQPTQPNQFSGLDNMKNRIIQDNVPSNKYSYQESILNNNYNNMKYQQPNKMFSDSYEQPSYKQPPQYSQHQNQPRNENNKTYGIRNYDINNKQNQQLNYFDDQQYKTKSASAHGPLQQYNSDFQYQNQQVAKSRDLLPPVNFNPYNSQQQQQQQKIQYPFGTNENAEVANLKGKKQFEMAGNNILNFRTISQGSQINNDVIENKPPIYKKQFVKQELYKHNNELQVQNKSIHDINSLRLKLGGHKKISVDGDNDYKRAIKKRIMVQKDQTRKEKLKKILMYENDY